MFGAAKQWTSVCWRMAPSRWLPTWSKPVSWGEQGKSKEQATSSRRPPGRHHPRPTGHTPRAAADRRPWPPRPGVGVSFRQALVSAGPTSRRTAGFGGSVRVEHERSVRLPLSRNAPTAYSLCGRPNRSRRAKDKPPSDWVRWTSWSVSRVLFPGASRRSRSATIHLGGPLPARSSGSPAGSGGPPSNACAHPTGAVGAVRTLSTLLRVGFTEPHRSPGTLVVSYTTVSPSPAAPDPKAQFPQAVCFLWHFPAAHAGLPLTTTLPCGARTFLGGGIGLRRSPPTRSPDQLVRAELYRRERLAGCRRVRRYGRAP